jgi:hypothetical protein
MGIGTAKIFDSSGNNLDSNLKGRLKVTGDSTNYLGQESLLTGILKEMKKMNLYLAIMTDQVMENTEVN